MRAFLGLELQANTPDPSCWPRTQQRIDLETHQAVVDWVRKRLRRTLRYADESTPTRRARPRGVIGAGVWVKVAAPGDPRPGDPGELMSLPLSTPTPARADFITPPA